MSEEERYEYHQVNLNPPIWLRNPDDVEIGRAHV
jgi:hypothetical protein